MTTGRATELLELGVADPMQLFNSMDPAPFRDRDLDPEVVTYILDWAHDVPRGAPLGLNVTLLRHSATADAGILRAAFQQHFRRRAQANRRDLKRLFRRGRIGLVIGLAFLATAIFISDYLGHLISSENSAWFIQESVVIGGWVALWNPLNIFLYDWWPIRAEARLFDRLSAMDVRLVNGLDSGLPANTAAGY